MEVYIVILDDHYQGNKDVEIHEVFSNLDDAIYYVIDRVEKLRGRHVDRKFKENLKRDLKCEYGYQTDFIIKKYKVK